MKKNINRNIGIIFLVLLIVVTIFFLGNFSTIETIFGEKQCSVIKECGNNCEILCSSYDKCEYFEYNGKNIMCINDLDVVVEIVETNNQMINYREQQIGGGIDE